MNLTPEETKVDIIKDLFKSRNANISWPSGITVTWQCEGKKSLRLELDKESCKANMQKDSAAFEGWALVLKAELEDEIENIELRWEQPEDPNNLHYQRFLYRVIRFSQAMSWFKVSMSSIKLLEDSCIFEKDGNIKIGSKFYINYGENSKRKIKDGLVFNENKHSEDALEKYIYNNREIFLLGISHDTLSVKRQIPVGIFKDKVSTGAEFRVFTGGKSAIDLCGVDKEGNVVVFELKKKGNNTVGCISETIFYTNIIRDVQRGLITYEMEKLNKEKDFECKLQKDTTVKGYLLADDIHPLLDNSKLFNLLNSGFLKRNISYGFMRYDLKNMKSELVYP